MQLRKESIFENVNITVLATNCDEEPIVDWDYTRESLFIGQLIFGWKSQVVKIPSDSFLLQHIKNHHVFLTRYDEQMLSIHMHSVNGAIVLVDKMRCQ